METGQIKLRERCKPRGALARRHRFVLGATVPGEFRSAPLACSVRLLVVCGLLVSATALPERASLARRRRYLDRPRHLGRGWADVVLQARHSKGLCDKEDSGARSDVHAVG